MDSNKIQFIYSNIAADIGFRKKHRPMAILGVGLNIEVMHNVANELPF